MDKVENLEQQVQALSPEDVHVQHATGEAKFWLEPELKLAQNYGLSSARINTALRIIRGHQNEIRAAWKKHFGR
ncbi:MAG: hypothetical protein AUH81_19340 [Candidatus Rokubacteria bacterium 13_1_40CM_4_69_5]|nr:MAG: hypothetical protein AUH81_19340 [Candidatus Rokubacteria bacterium 13_1_40CM_4_69_5]